MEHILNPGGPNDRQSILLETRRRRHIPNEQRYDLPPTILKEAEEQLRTQHPAWQLRSIGRAYNCIGHVFASRRTWIEPEHFKLITDDDGYRPLPDKGRPMPGDIAVYYREQHAEIVHVGIVVNVGADIGRAEHILTVLSKFGACGEYVHPASEIPMALSIGGPVKQVVWTERTEFP
jgi:hypothetical protein